MKQKKQGKDVEKEHDLTQLAKDIEGIVLSFFKLDERPGIAIALTLPPVFEDVHWITNLTREDGIRLLESTAFKMKAKTVKQDL
jgi:hypothetical protein